MPVVSLPISQESDDVDAWADGSGFLINGESGSFVLALSGSTLGSRRNMGLRFEGDTPPPGSTINQAYVRLNVDNTFRDDAYLDIFGVLEGNPATFNGVDRHPIPTHISFTTASVFWQQFGTGTGYVDSPSIISIIEEIIALPDYADNNPIAVVLAGGNNSTAYDISTYDINSGQPTALLVLDYTEPVLTPVDAQSEGNSVLVAQSQVEAVVAPPSIDTVTPDTFQDGDSVIIDGSNFES